MFLWTIMITTSNMSLSLVVLAAGRGARFGGDKPLAEVGPDGQSLFEYSVHDAVKSGISHIVFVVSEGQDKNAFTGMLARYGDALEVDFVVQALNTCVDEKRVDRVWQTRSKPWGTGHAVLVCRDIIHNPFIVINADDFYGYENFQRIGQFLRDNASNPTACAMPGYPLSCTLSSSGSVNRGICQIDSEGNLLSITEVKDISCDGNQNYSVNQVQCNTLTSESIVSMTFWGFHPSIFDILDREFNSFLTDGSDLISTEFFIPAVIDHAINAGILQVKVFPTSARWQGLTFASDLSEVRSFIARLLERGEYTALQRK